MRPKDPITGRFIPDDADWPGIPPGTPLAMGEADTLEPRDPETVARAGRAKPKPIRALDRVVRRGRLVLCVAFLSGLLLGASFVVLAVSGMVP